MTGNMIDTEFDDLIVRLFNSKTLGEYHSNKEMLHQYLNDAILKERQRCANLARTVSAERHGVHRYSVRDHSDDTGDYIADAILEGEK